MAGLEPTTEGSLQISRRTHKPPCHRCPERACAWGVGGTVAYESALRSAGTLLSRIRAPPSAPPPDGGP
ncbi:hypothetical protein PoB_004239900 [Plakobranchus ocellatus]|uniref:Uncharacterized protein n=1 Tax=Plakobranchus ocellatus TaxID=259542 RepID=A0AAV4BB25_9GAST|nr:hypothetical protein PoB_004239900 [Plakobranchus ocellatus]